MENFNSGQVQLFINTHTNDHPEIKPPRKRRSHLVKNVVCKFPDCGKTYASKHASRLHYRLKHETPSITHPEEGEVKKTAIKLTKSHSLPSDDDVNNNDANQSSTGNYIFKSVFFDNSNIELPQRSTSLTIVTEQKTKEFFQEMQEIENDLFQNNQQSYSNNNNYIQQSQNNRNSFNNQHQPDNTHSESGVNYSASQKVDDILDIMIHSYELKQSNESLRNSNLSTSYSGKVNNNFNNSNLFTSNNYNVNNNYNRCDFSKTTKDSTISNCFAYLEQNGLKESQIQSQYHDHLTQSRYSATETEAHRHQDHSQSPNTKVYPFDTVAEHPKMNSNGNQCSNNATYNNFSMYSIHQGSANNHVYPNLNPSDLQQSNSNHTQNALFPKTSTGYSKAIQNENVESDILQNIISFSKPKCLFQVELPSLIPQNSTPKP
eukprot:Awhi_evm1s15029